MMRGMLLSHDGRTANLIGLTEDEADKILTGQILSQRFAKTNQPDDKRLIIITTLRPCGTPRLPHPDEIPPRSFVIVICQEVVDKLIQQQGFYTVQGEDELFAVSVGKDIDDLEYLRKAHASAFHEEHNNRFRPSLN